MVESPHAPWHLAGAGLFAWVPGRKAASARAALPDGVRPLPGPAVVIGVRYDASPVGPYVELAIAHPARVGLRPGLCVTRMVVSSQAARTGLRLNWGMPSEVGTLRWIDAHEDHGPAIAWDEGGVELQSQPRGPAVPLVVPVRAIQRRADGPVVVPRRVFGRTRLARVEVSVASRTGGDDESSRDLEWLAGHHRGLVVAGVRLVVHPARQPLGLLSSFRAPLRAPEPALADSGSRPGRVTLLPGA